MSNVSRSIGDRFWSKVDKNGPVHPALGPCWIWSACLLPNGYGMFDRRNAHRVAWELARGPIPRGMLVMHLCDDNYAPGDKGYRRCVNPAHLRVGTHAENSADMVAKGRAAVGERNGSRLYPERMPRGDRHKSRTKPETVPRGERGSTSKLTEVAVRTIVARHAAGGVSLSALAREYGVTVQSVHAIVHRKSWRHLWE